MALELPITTALVSHSQNAAVQTAAMLMLGGLAIWIESPVIDLLATSTTLSKTPRDFATISRFTWWLMAWCTLLHAAIALTPLYDIVSKTILGVPADVAEAARIPMAITIPWSAFIGWRRYLQGILIRFGRTRIIGWGTGVRVFTMALASLLLFRFSSLTGVEMAAVALVSSVTAEALFIHWASRETIARNLRPGTGAEEPGAPISMKRLAAFHMPLTATTMTFMLSLPLVSAAIARSPDGVAAMAAWQVATSLAFLHRTVVFALPEPVIALYKGPHTAERLARFCGMVGIGASALIAVLWLMGLDGLFFANVLGAEPDIVRLASLAYLASIALPFIGSVQSYLRGMLTAHHFTVARFAAVIVSTCVLIAFLVLGVVSRWPGIVVAAIAVTASALAEMSSLVVAWRIANRRMALAGA